jgi:hypothetical protein
MEKKRNCFSFFFPYALPFDEKSRRNRERRK